MAMLVFGESMANCPQVSCESQGARCVGGEALKSKAI